jgi:DNA (cytosine-5)-methyltransferase 1
MPFLGHRPIAIDLFAGAGGFSLGIEQAGFEVAVAVEHDPVHAGVYAFNFPQTKVLCRDIASLSGRVIKEELKQWRKSSGYIRRDRSIDLVFGGPPCQGFSLMGKGQVDDVRNNLIFEFCRLVKELQPRYFVMENVPGLKLKKYADMLERLVDEFKAAGYEITEPVKILNAASFGVPQKRRRLFLLGARAGQSLIVYPKPKLPSPSQYITVEDAIADLPNLDNFIELQKTDCLQLTPTQLEQIEASATIYVKMLRNLTKEPDNLAYLRQWNRDQITSSLQTQHGTVAIKRFEQTAGGTLEPISRLRRLHWHKPCNTLRAGTGYERGSFTSPRPIHPEYPRVISVREAARLHSFPDWFRLHVTKWHGFRQVGNAVPPLLARALGCQLIAVLGVKPKVPKTVLELGDPQLLRLTLVTASKYWEIT